MTDKTTHITPPDPKTTQVTLVNEPAPTTTKRAPSRRGSIRTRFLWVGLLPILTLGGPWLYNTVVTQRINDERVLLESVEQLTSNFAERIIDLEEAMGLPLREPALVQNALGRTETLIQSSKLPITNVVIMDQDLNVAVAYSSKFPQGSALTDQNIVARWQKENPAVLAAVKKVAKNTFDDLLLAQSGFRGTITAGDEPVTLASALIPGNEGVVVITIDPQYVANRVRENLMNTLLVLLLSLPLTVIAVTLAARPIIQRMRLLSTNIERASKTSYDEDPVEIRVDGNDEITTVQESAKKIVGTNRALASLLEEEDDS